MSFSFFYEHVKHNQRYHSFIVLGLGLIAILNSQDRWYLFLLSVLFILAMSGIVFFSLRYQRIEKSLLPLNARARWLIRTATWQVLLNLILISGAIHLSGGALSPIPVLYIIYLGTISVFFHPRELLGLNLMAILFYTCLMQGYVWGWYGPVGPIPSYGILITPSFVQKIQIFYTGALVVNAILITSHANRTQRDWQDVDAQNAYLDRLHGLTKLGLERMELAELYDILAAEVKQVLQADGLYITWWDDESGQVYTGATSPRDHDTRRIVRVSTKFDTTITQSVMRAGVPLVAEDVTCTPYMSPGVARNYKVTSLLGVPMYGMPDRQFLGALLVGYTDRHIFSQTEIICAQQVADVAALLISRTRLYDETQRRASLLEQMAEQFSRLTSDLRKTTLLPAIVESARGLLKAERAALHMIQKTSRKMHCEFSVGLSDDYLDYLAYLFDESPEAQALNSQNYLLVPDVQRDSRTTPILGLIAREKFMAYAVFALDAPDGNLGTLSLYWDQPHAISSEEVAVGCLFAKRAGVLLQNVRLYERVSEEALTDILTNLPNRRYIDQRLAEESQRSDRYGHPYVLLMIDLDGFKSINDSFGHPIGDSVLKQVSDSLQRVLRSTDTLTRYGGDEFAIILPETSLEEAILVAEKLQATLASTRLHLPNETQRFISGCMGLASYPLDANSSTELVKVADKRMYDAKRKGGDSIISN